MLTIWTASERGEETEEIEEEKKTNTRKPACEKSMTVNLCVVKYACCCGHLKCTKM